MASIGSLVIDLLAKTGTFETDMGRAARTAEKRSREIDRSISRMGSRIKGALTGLFVGFSFSKIIEETSKAETALAKLDNAVKNNAGAAGASTSQLAAFSEELQRLTTFSDETVQEMQALLLSFRQIGGGEFKRAQVAILDLATALGRDLNSSALLVGRALADPVKGMTALSRAGIVLAKDQKDLIKSLVETGKASEAQQVLLGELEKRFGGAAAAARNTFGGAIAGLKNAFGDLLEAKGGLPEATEQINKLSALLSDPQTKSAADDFLGGFIKGLSAAAVLIAEVFDRLGSAIGAAGATAAAVARGDFREAFSIIKESNLDTLKSLKETGKALEDIFSQAPPKPPEIPFDTRRGFGQGPAPIAPPIDSDEFKKARDEIQQLIDSTRAQIKSMDDGAEAAVRFRLTQGDLADEMKLLGAQGEKLAGQLIEASKALDVSKATEQLEDLSESLKAQSQGLDDNQAAAIRYRLELGDLADTVKLAGEAGEKLKIEIINAAEAKQQKDDLNDIATAILGINSQIDELQGKSVDAALSQFDKANEKLSKDIARSGTQADADRLKTLRDLVEAQAKFNELQTEATRITSELAIQEERIGNSQRTGAITELDALNQLDEARKEAAAALDDIYEKQQAIAVASGNPALIENAKKFAAEIDNLRAQTDLFAQKLKSTFEESAAGPFADFITGAKSASDAVKDFAASFEREIAQLIAKDLLGRLFGVLGGVGGGAAGGGAGWLSALSSIFGGGRATGGPVNAGTMYRVNERGGEFFKPNVGGKVIPLSQMPGMGAANVYVTVEAPRGTVSTETRLQVGNAAAAALASARRRNG